MDSAVLELTDKLATLLDGQDMEVVIPSLSWLLAEASGEMTDFSPDKSFVVGVTNMYLNMYADLCSINQTAPNGATLN